MPDRLEQELLLLKQTVIKRMLSKYEKRLTEEGEGAITLDAPYELFDPHTVSARLAGTSRTVEAFDPKKGVSTGEPVKRDPVRIGWLARVVDWFKRRLGARRS